LGGQCAEIVNLEASINNTTNSTSNSTTLTDEEAEGILQIILIIVGVIFLLCFAGITWCCKKFKKVCFGEKEVSKYALNADDST